MIDEAEARKKRSIEILKKNNIPYIDGLPVIETSDEVHIRPVTEIARRAAVLIIVAGFACDICFKKDIKEAYDFFYAKLRQYKLSRYLTKNERMFFRKPDKETAEKLTWRYEAAFVILWVLGKVDSLYYPEKICSEKAIIQLLAKYDDFDEFVADAVLRPTDAILNEADLIYRYDWAIVDARLNNIQYPGNLNPDVVYEWHKALNWIIGYGIGNKAAKWDEVTTDT